jgi:hypothetical protein
MRPLTIVVVGLAFVVLDFRIEALDLLPDALGWAAVALGAARLGLLGAARLAVVTGVVSLADAWLPFHYVWLNPVTGEEAPGSVAGEDGPVHLRYDDISGWQLAALTSAMVLGACTIWALLSGCARRAEGDGRDLVARRLRLARWLVVGTWTVPFVGAVLQALASRSGDFDPVWNGRLTYTWVAAVVVFAAVAALLVQERDRQWALPPGRARVSPRHDGRRRTDGASSQAARPPGSATRGTSDGPRGNGGITSRG